MNTRATLVAQGRGRPPKYGRPARAITLTLPEDTLSRLGAVDADLGRAIVRIVERRTRSRVPVPAIRPAELVSYGNNAVIVVMPVKALRRLPGVQLVPIENGRCLIALESSHSIPQLELDIRDALERVGLTGIGRTTLEAVAEILRGARASRDTRPEERTIIVLQTRRQRRPPERQVVRRAR
jgi:hypothetical protein